MPGQLIKVNKYPPTALVLKIRHANSIVLPFVHDIQVFNIEINIV